MLHSIVAISVGATLGALLRWGLGLTLNHFWPLIPLGTLVANLLGGLLIGLALSFFAQFPLLDDHWRLLVITGFLGSLTTFSTFSAEVTTLLRAGRLYWATGAVALHVCGSLFMTFCGMALFALCKHFSQHLTR